MTARLHVHAMQAIEAMIVSSMLTRSCSVTAHLGLTPSLGDSVAL